MPQVRAALAAARFRAHHAMAGVAVPGDRAWTQWLGETGPSGAGIKLLG
jgi:hypothetical protein